MSAYNQRIAPFRWMGMPGYVVIASMVSLVALLLTLTFPLTKVRFVFGLMTAIAVLALIATIILGDRVMFANLLIDSWLDRLARSTIRDSE